MPQNNAPVLPYDIFQSYIIPEILSQHIHSLLVDQEQPSWHPFYVLPLVCRTFNETCRSLIVRIFGIDPTSSKPDLRTDDNEPLDDNESDLSESESTDDLSPAYMLEYAMSVSQKAYRPDSHMSLTYHYHNTETLLEQTSLVRLYTCIALGKLFLNVDVLCPLGILRSNTSSTLTGRTRRRLWDEDYDDDEENSGIQTTFDEENLHRFFMPFECAQILCDRMVPDRLAMVAARYMAEVLPFYHSLFMLAKYYRDLRFNVDRDYEFTLDYYTEWILDTLTLLENAKIDLIEMMKTGRMIYSFWQDRTISREAIKVTRILEALDDVVKAEWSDDHKTAQVRKRASALILAWTR